MLILDSNSSLQTWVFQDLLMGSENIPAESRVTLDLESRWSCTCAQRRARPQVDCAHILSIQHRRTSRSSATVSITPLVPIPEAEWNRLGAVLLRAAVNQLDRAIQKGTGSETAMANLLEAASDLSEPDIRRIVGKRLGQRVIDATRAAKVTRESQPKKKRTRFSILEI